MQESWEYILRWHRQAKGRQSPRFREYLEYVTMERVELYRCRPLEGLQVPILVITAAVDNGITSEAEIKQAVRDLKKGIADGLSSITQRGGCGSPCGEEPSV